MKNLTLMLACMAIMMFQSFAQNGDAYSNYQGKPVFIKSTPTEAYTVVGKAAYKDSKKNVGLVGADATGIRKVIIGINDVMKKVEKGKQEEFDGVIVYSPTKMELITFNDKSLATNTNCTVAVKGYLKRKCGDKDIYLLTLPLKNYTVVKEVEVKNFSNLGQLKMGKDAIDNFMNKLYEKSCKLAKEGVDFDAIFLDDTQMMVSQGLLSTKVIKLIKYN